MTRRRVDVLAVEDDLADVGLDKPYREAGERRFSAATFADESRTSPLEIVNATSSTARSSCLPITGHGRPNRHFQRIAPRAPAM